jgi:succinate dehydrogenase / fumarate reductase membrane anchor subunit
MATRTDAVPGAMARPKAQRSSFEQWAWRYMRWSGVLLIPLAFGHLLIMHIINSVYTIDYHWVITTRWAFVPWRLYDAGLLWFAGLHGYNGLRIVIKDYVTSPVTKQILYAATVIVAIGILVVGSLALVLAPVDPVLDESARLILSAL